MNPTKLLESSGVAAVIYAMPEQVQSELSQIGDELDDRRWRLGEIANALKKKADQYKLSYKDERGNKQPVSYQDVYTACSIMVKRKVSARTIAYYAMLEEFFPGDAREKYEPLPLTHFAFAHQFKDRWSEILDLAYSRFELTNRMPSEEWLRMAWGEKLHMDGVAEISISDDVLSCDLSKDTISVGDRESAKERTSGWLIAEQLYRLVQSIESSVPSLPIDGGLRDELQKAITALTKALDRVMIAIDRKRD